MVNLDNELDYNNCKAFEGELIPLLAQQNHVVINCELITALPKDWFRALHRLQCDLKKNKKILKLIHVGHSTLIDMKREGIESIFEMSKDLSSALKDFGMVIKRSLDTEFINPFLNATMNVLQIQAGVDVVAGKVFRKQDTDRFYGDISGLIGIISDAFTGSVVISFPEETFLKVMSKMLGEEYTKIDQDIVDGAGEITNMIFGQAKIVLNEKG